MSTTFFCVVFSSFLIPSIRTTSIDQKDIDKSNVPLKFEDIVDKKIYDKMRPPKPGGQPTKVEFHVTVMSLDSINEGSMTYAADIFFGQEWDDHRLKLPANMTSEYRLLPVEWLEEIWRPDSFFKNAKAVTFQRMTIPNHYLWLYRSKKIMYMVKLTLLLSCAMNFHKYPHDEQLCKMSMESLSHTTEDLVFQWLPEDATPLVVDEGIELPQLELIQNFTSDCTTNYSTGSFTCLEVVFRFKRRLGYFMFHTYIPTCLIVMMSWISFWIKPEAVPARVTLGVTSLLTLSTQHANSQKSLPPVSYIKAIDMFMSSCTFFVFLSLIEYAFVNVMMGDISEIERKDRGAHMKNLVNHHKFLKNSVNLCNSKQNQMDPYHETSLTTKNGAHHELEARPCGGGELGLGLGGCGSKDQGLANEQEVFTDPTNCPRHSGSNNLEGRVGEISNFRHMLGLDSVMSSTVTNPPPNSMTMGAGPGPYKARTIKDSKEIMKKRRERAICIDRVSRVLFPSTFILLNIIYWLVFSDILDSLHPNSDLQTLPNQ